MLSALISKEFKALFREPMVVVMILMPFIAYTMMGSFLSSAVQQAEVATKLKGVDIAIGICGLNATQHMIADMLAERLRTAGANVTIANVCNESDVLKLIRSGYDTIVVIPRNFAEVLTKGNATLRMYVRGDISRIMFTFTIAGVVFSKLRPVFAPAKHNVSMETFIVLKDRVMKQEDIMDVYNAATTLSYATFMILFPAASLGAALVGAEREERMLEVLLSLPVRRRDIAIAKACAALAAATLTTAAALAGLFYMFRSAGLPLNIVRAYGATELALYVGALASEALFAVALAMMIGLFSTSIRGAQAASTIVVIPAFIPPFLLIAGVPLSYTLAAVPYMAAVYAALAPLIGAEYAQAAVAFQFIEAILVLALLVKMFESEVAVTGPETLKRLFGRRRRG